jgi:hypothetical protein
METIWNKRGRCSGEPSELIGRGRSAGEVMRLPDPVRRSGIPDPVFDASTGIRGTGYLHPVSASKAGLG